MGDHNFSVVVGMYELSRTKPRQHLIDELAEQLLVAARVGATVLDDDLDYEAGVRAALGDEPLYGSPYIDVKDLLLELLDYVPDYLRDKWNLDAQVGTVIRMWPQEQLNE